MEIQQLNKSNIPDLLSLCKAVGWLQHESFMKTQFEMYLSVGTLFGCIHNKTLIAAGGVFPFESGFSSIGMLIVHPNFQKQGLGRTILDVCVQHAPASLPIMLVATDVGVPLYQANGFTTITTIHRFEKLVTHTPMNTSHLKQVHQHDLDSLLKLDQVATSVHRPHLYSLLLARATFTFKIERNNRIEAFALCMQKGDTLCVTPLIAKQEEDAIQLLQMICKSWNGTIRIDIPHSQFTFREHLQTENFQETLLSPLMIKNGSHLSGNRNILFAMMDTALC
ncbi:GNAT family N-acetyltransferase [Bacillus sp. DX1.1]|uniref:GNAT family N-acetyltransferase n=1 Tax=unclassified Bacillus (in: firmicutes) TaxID=185979 RepID=UPI002570A191|nr:MULTISPECIES: GNAT family N-acetyltransferase [unclassified Bacillus (in: firmicutes)]MDM5156543.1 GNAT family N-acetyltransferase [Bacillus sp. DX1.1]WJE80807.1 GNAT family N-acetyltransferase [Bacillus sp. DX3.1]